MYLHKILYLTTEFGFRLKKWAWSQVPMALNNEQNEQILFFSNFKMARASECFPRRSGHAEAPLCLNYTLQP